VSVGVLKWCGGGNEERKKERRVSPDQAGKDPPREKTNSQEGRKLAGQEGPKKRREHPMGGRKGLAEQYRFFLFLFLLVTLSLSSLHREERMEAAFLSAQILKS